jgi:hypothetical protein
MESILLAVFLAFLVLGIALFSPLILLYWLLEAIFKKPSPPPPPPVKQPRRRKPRRKTARQLEFAFRP